MAESMPQKRSCGAIKLNHTGSNIAEYLYSIRDQDLPITALLKFLKVFCLLQRIFNRQLHPNLIENCGAVAKTLLDECHKVIIVLDLYPAWCERGMKPCRHEVRQTIFRSLEAENVDLQSVFLVCIQEELEAWLLADNRAVMAMLQPLKHPHTVGRISWFFSLLINCSFNQSKRIPTY